MNPTHATLEDCANWDFFIAHASADSAVAGELFAQLTPKFRVFLDTQILQPGDEWDIKLAEAQHAARITVILISPVFDSHYYLRDEIATAIALARKDPTRHRVVPVCLDTVACENFVPYGLRHLSWLDARHLGGMAGVARELTKVAESVPAAFPPRQELKHPVTAHQRFDLYQRLCHLSGPEFEEVVLRLGIPVTELSSLDTPRTTRAIEALHSLGQTGHLDLAVVGQAIQAVRGHPPSGGGGLGTTVRSLVGSVFTSAFPRWYYALVAGGRLAAPAEFHAVQEYLDYFANEMKSLNRGEPASKVFVEPRAGEVPANPLVSADYAPPILKTQVLKRVRQALRLLSGLAQGGDQTTAQLASVSHRSRLVRDVVTVLLRSAQPVILLGDPGSGKSMTLREVGLQIALRERHRVRPRLVVYVRLGQYRSVVNGLPGDVFDLIRQSIPPAHQAVTAALPKLIAEQRLVVLFDGMDEMERRLYGQRIAKLSNFARHNAPRIKSLFACRINEFSIEFEHRQMVLLPFNRRQITQYVLANMPGPIEVDGRRWKAPRLADRLLSGEGIGEAATNPLMLFLVCHYLRLTNQWPDTRANLFRVYVETLLRRLEHVGGAGSRRVDRDRLNQGWSKMAFLMTRNYCGIYLDLTKIESEFGAEAAAELTEAGRDCGLLMVDAGDEQAARFAHHRLQEYFTACYLAREQPALDWSSLLDTPRWQEALLTLMSISLQTPVLDAVAESMAVLPPEPPPSSEPGQDQANWLLDADTERRLADRVLLASHIVREIGFEKGRLSSEFLKRYANALAYLAHYGRPTTQVKMLWAWKNNPNVGSVEALSTPLRSEIDWVRDQAVTVVAGLAGSRTHIGTNVHQEIALDFASGQFLRRLPAYWRSAQGSQLSLPLLVWAAFCQCLFPVGVVLSCWGLIHLVLQFFPVPHVDPLLAEAACLVVLISAIPLCRSWFPENPWRGALYAALAIGLLVYFLHTMVKENFGWALLSTVGYSYVASGVIVLLVQVAYWLPFWLFQSAFLLFWRGSVLLLPVLSVAGKYSEIKKEKNILAISISYLGILLMGFVGPFLIDHLVASDFLENFFIRVLFYMLGFVAPTLCLLKTWKDCRLEKHRWWGKFLRRFWINLILHWISFCAVVFVWWLLSLAFISDAARWGAAPLVGAIFFAVVISVVIYLLRELLLVLEVKQWVARASLGEWHFRVAAVKQYKQYLYLRYTSHQILAVTPGEFLQVLVDLETHIAPGRAASQYWKMRHGLEQAIRQETLEQ